MVRPDTAPGTSITSSGDARVPTQVGRALKTKSPGEYRGCRQCHVEPEATSGGVAAFPCDTLLEVAAIDQVGLGLTVDHGIVHDHLADVLQ
jgi:hypothetical protein